MAFAADMPAPIHPAQLRKVRLTVPQVHLREVPRGQARAGLKVLWASHRNFKRKSELAGSNDTLDLLLEGDGLGPSRKTFPIRFFGAQLVRPRRRNPVRPMSQPDAAQASVYPA